MGSLRAPLSVQLELTYSCNHYCIYCFNHIRDVVEKKIKQVKVCLWEEIKKILSTLADHGVFNIVLTGGEPLLRQDVAIKAVEYCTSRNIRVTLNTNAILLTPDILESLKNGGVYSLLISCPSMHADLYNDIVQQNNFDKFLHAMELVKYSGLKYSINMVVNHANYHDVEYTARKLHGEFNCQMFSATPMSLNACYPQSQDGFLTSQEVTKLVERLVSLRDNFGIETDVFESLVSCVIPDDIRKRDLGLTRRYCTAGRSVMVVGPNGDVRPCGHAPMNYGNILNDKFDDIWQSMSPWRENEYVPDGCKECGFLARCKGGCRISALAKFGSLYANDPWMREPISERPLKKKIHTLSDLDDGYMISEPFRYRKEREGEYLVCTKGTNNLIRVNEPFFKFIIGLRASNVFSANQLVNTYGFDIEHVVRLLSILKSNRIILPEPQTAKC